MANREHWLVRTAKEMNEGEKGARENLESLVWRFQGAMEGVAKNDMNAVGDKMTPKKKLKEIVELSEALSEAMEVLRKWR
ncbi:hypothetical protein BCSAG_48560 [Bacillus cereus]|uniref:hypothetical protein n=1 Tax=Bacillus cereus TaxID=1396 RepID=UPI003980D998